MTPETAALLAFFGALLAAFTIAWLKPMPETRRVDQIDVDAVHRAWLKGQRFP